MIMTMPSEKFRMVTDDGKAYQIAFVDKEQHMLVAGIALDVLFQMFAARAQGIPCVQHL